jgi:hypothetical protein
MSHFYGFSPLEPKPVANTSHPDFLTPPQIKILPIERAEGSYRSDQVRDSADDQNRILKTIQRYEHLLEEPHHINDEKLQNLEAIIRPPDNSNAKQVITELLHQIKKAEAETQDNLKQGRFDAKPWAAIDFRIIEAYWGSFSDLQRRVIIDVTTGRDLESRQVPNWFIRNNVKEFVKFAAKMGEMYLAQLQKNANKAVFNAFTMDKSDEITDDKHEVHIKFLEFLSSIEKQAAPVRLIARKRDVKIEEAIKKFKQSRKQMRERHDIALKKNQPVIGGQAPNPDFF